MKGNSLLRDARNRKIQKQFEKLEQEAIKTCDYALYQEAKEWLMVERAELVIQFGPWEIEEPKKEPEIGPSVMRKVYHVIAEIRDLVTRKR